MIAVPALRPPRLTLALAAVVLLSADASAVTVRLSASDAGSALDGLVDGFPGIAPLDGTADVGGNALAVGLKSGVTEERGVVEFSLAALAGVSADAIDSATLGFNVDDVLATFGPGTEFDGTASETIFVRSYSGDGAVGLDDFGRGDAVGQVAVGSVTDETLGSSGPLLFQLEVTEALRSVLAGGGSHLGIVFVTDDSPTGTSLDDLGIGSAGPPGVGGATLPFLEVEYGGGPVTTPTPGPNPTPTPPAASTPTPVPSIDPNLGPIATKPIGLGDQVLYYWDGRDGFTTFLTLRNLGDDALTVELQLYGPDFDEPFVDTVSLDGDSAMIFDVQALVDRGLVPEFGLAVAHAVGPSGEALVSRALAGSFTVANLATSSAWGAVAPARIAVSLGAQGTSLPAVGEMIDGQDVLLRAIRPERLVLPLYFDPDTLDPAELDGNQIVFLSFNDEAGAPYRATARSTTWDVTAHASDGSPVADVSTTVEGARISDIVETLGEAARGSSGSARLQAHSGGAYNRLVLFTQSLAAFGTGVLLPEEALE